MTWFWCFLCTAALFVRACLGQSTITVTVGASGSFFEPPLVSAQTGDIISFVFQQASHSVIQTTFGSPCFPMKGGFSSGLVTRQSDAVPAPVWNLKITNSSQPIWFYCGNTVPSSHCASGMVGGINVPTTDDFDAFVNFAKFAQNPPTSIPVVLTGQGAVATATPQAPQPSSIIAIPVSSSSTTTSPTMSSTTGSTTTSSPSQSSSHKNLGAIIGGAVGGGVGLILILLLAFLFFRKRQRREDRGSKDFFRYNAATPDLSKMQPMFVSARMTKEPDRSKAVPPVEKGLGYGSSTRRDEKAAYPEKYNSAPSSTAGHTNVSTTAASTPYSSPTPLIAKNIAQTTASPAQNLRGISEEGKKGKAAPAALADPPIDESAVSAGLAARSPRKGEGPRKLPDVQQASAPPKPAAVFKFHNPAYHMPDYAIKSETQAQSQQTATQAQAQSQSPPRPRAQPLEPRPQAKVQPRSQPQPQQQQQKQRSRTRVQPQPPSQPSLSSPSSNATLVHKDRDTKLSPRRVPAPTLPVPPPVSTQHHQHHQPPLQETDAGPVSNMDALARQVAAVLLERPTTLRAQPLGPRQPGDSTRSSYTVAEEPAPPRYGAGTA